MFYGQANKINERRIVAKVSSVERVNVASTPLSEHECRWISFLHEHQIEQQTPNSAVAIGKRVEGLKIVMGNRAARHGLILHGIVTAKPTDPLL